MPSDRDQGPLKDFRVFVLVRSEPERGSNKYASLVPYNLA